MAIKGSNPYLMFDGTADQAVKLYESALGARTEGLQRFGDVPGMKGAPEHKDRVMHAVLHMDSGMLMLSDAPPGSPYTAGANVHVVLDFDDVADMTRKFEALSAGGQVTMPLQDTFWGAKFGTLTDRYGVPWMFNCTTKKG